MKKFFLFIFICIILFVIAKISIHLFLSGYADQPAGTDPTKQAFHVKPGQSFHKTANMLYDSELIKQPLKFELLARIKGYDKRIKSGEYLFSTVMSPTQILTILSSGKVRLHRLTIPEGYTLNQIADIIEKAGLSNRKEFSDAATDTSFVQELSPQAQSLEGYLYPDTYFFPSGITGEKIVSTMINRFNAVFSNQWKQRAQQLGFNIHEIVTFASIIEKETGASFERPIISSVFHNRLKKRMRLESDPTVIYGIKNFTGNITRKDLSALTPYNTYKIRGLPPGPIANPGAGSLKAALYPKDTKFLYFVSKKDGTHKFSTNIKDHNKAVYKYQISK